MPKIEAFAYIRVSGESQVEKDGPERQRRVIASWAKRNKAIVLKEFADLGVSGTTQWEARPAMLLMFNQLVASGGQPPVVVVERPDRLARDLIAGELILQRLRQLGVRVVLAENGQDLTSDDSPTGRLVRQILGAVAEFDRASITLKLRNSRANKRKLTGKCEGRLFYGQKPGEEGGLAIISAGKKEKKSLSEIARLLQRSGFQTRLGGPWSRSSIAKIIKRLPS